VGSNDGISVADAKATYAPALMTAVENGLSLAGYSSNDAFATEDVIVSRNSKFLYYKVTFSFINLDKARAATIAWAQTDDFVSTADLLCSASYARLEVPDGSLVDVLKGWAIRATGTCL
jgi:hypothetical protein